MSQPITFLEQKCGAWILGVCTPKFTQRGIACRATICAKFFQNYNILPRSAVRIKSLRVGSKNTPNFVTFWQPCSLRMTRKKSLNYRVGQKVAKFGIFSHPTRKLSALTPERGRIL